MTTSTEQHNGFVGTTAAMATASSSCTTHAPAMAPVEKLGKFSGVDFKRWQQKMFFYPTTLSLQHFISEETPENERFVVMENALEKKYKTEDAGLKKFVAAKFLDFKMIDGKSVIKQVRELQVIVHDLLAEGYSDANRITGSSEINSTSGYVFTIGGGVVSWKSSKQTCIARSTMESEFIALDKAGEEAEWLWNFLEDIPFWPKPMALICIHYDSQAAIGRAGSIMYNGKSRHI
ncbi:uncharacterized protein [Nicotiana tomentosiformis]|uniref:uncharacterized protein n=1 Tax=Nicotiana tomentosiformis TaxID=4098 RepID=UPI00388CB8F4